MWNAVDIGQTYTLDELPDVLTEHTHLVLDARTGTLSQQLRRLADLETNKPLRRLHLIAGDQDTEGPSAWFHTLTALPLRTSLTHLAVASTDLSVLAAELPRHLRQLRELELAYTRLGGQELATIVSGLPRLKMLAVEGNSLGDLGVAKLMTVAPPTLCRLRLTMNDITPIGVGHLVASKLATHLTHLDLNENPIGVQGAHLLAQATTLHRLQELEVYESGIESAGLQALCESETLPRAVVASYVELRGSDDAHYVV